MNWKVPLADISFGFEEREAVRRVMVSGWVSMGPETEAFELEFAKYLGIKHAIAVSSGTAALHLALVALGIGPGDEVVVPSLTFVATANAIIYVGARPVFADIMSTSDLNISPEDIEKKITPRTKAIIVVHYGGFPCRMVEIDRLARQFGLKIVEDTAHAPGVLYSGKRLGTWGDIGCFSFFSNKNMTTAEGGMVVTNDDDAARRLKILRSHGMTTLTWDRHRGHSFSYDVIETGYNYRMDEIRAALGRVQLKKLNQNNRKRREVMRSLRKRLKVLKGISLPFTEFGLKSPSCHICPILLDDPKTRLQFMASMRNFGIQTSIHYPAIHGFAAYKAVAHEGLKITEEVSAREVTLPLFPTMSAEQIDLVDRAVQVSLKNRYRDYSPSS